MSSILKVDTIQDQSGNNIINESGNVITIGASGDTITVPAGATVSGFTSAGIDDNATSVAITINSSEQVGIGTTSPLRDLVVSNSGAEGYEFGPGETSDINQTLHYNRSSSAYIAHWQRASYHRFDTPTTEAMRLTSTGLGIGTSSPSAKLDVVDSSNSVQMVIRGRSSDNFAILQFKNNAGSAVKGEIKSDASNNLIFRAGASTDDLTILENGNIGIGQSTPGQKLDVVGNAEINGNIFNNGKLNIRKDGASEKEHLVITNESAGSNASPTFTDLHFNGYSGKDRGRIRVQDQSNNKTGGFMRIETTGGTDSTDGSGFETRIFLDNDGDIFFYEDTGTTPKVKWDATNERFGIGTTVPTSLLHLSSTSPVITFEETDQSNRQFQIGSFGNAYAIYDATNTQYRYILDNSGNHIFNEGGADCDFRVESDNSTHALFVQGSDGNVGINTNSPAHKIELHGDGGNTIFAIRDTDASPTFSNRYIKFQDANGTEIGKILRQGSAVSYSTSSDYRLKENVVEMTDATERLKQLQPKRFNFIGYDNVFDGFIAHEVSSIVPEAISGEKDAVNEDGTPEYQGIDQSKLVPLLVKTIQELEARITALETTTP